MKNLLRPALTVLSFLIMHIAIANTVVVKGTVKDSSGLPVAGKLVKIYSTDSTNQGCLISHNVYTNPNGYYQDTLKCTNDLKKLYIIVANCNGTNITADPNVVPNGTTVVVVERNFIICVPPPTPVINTSCKANFTISIKDSAVQFNSAASIASGTAAGTPLDTIISRIWYFGDSTSILSGTRVDPVHIYTKPGTYTVKLIIKTKLGCESSFTGTVVITKQQPCEASAQFSADRVSLKKVNFNSSASKALMGDSIIQRNWRFGDNTLLGGNTISPVKEYPVQGIYTVCLQVKTLNGCIAETCKTVAVQDTTSRPNISSNFVKILAINPNPVISYMRATIYSTNTVVDAEISIYDIYGVRKSSLTKTLLKGNNIIEIGTAQLYHGPYFLRVKTVNGTDTRIFYKL